MGYRRTRAISNDNTQLLQVVLLNSNFTKTQERGANGVLLVYDITDPKSFDSISEWVRQIKQYGSNSVELVLLGKTL